MSYAPFDTRAIAERLRATVPGLRDVRCVVDADSVRASAYFSAPGAYVLLPSETSGQSINGARVTPADTQFSIVMAQTSFRERRREAVTDEFSTLLAQVRAALIGWTPPGIGMTAIRWRGGRVYDADASTILWTEDYQLTHVLQA